MTGDQVDFPIRICPVQERMPQITAVGCFSRDMAKRLFWTTETKIKKIVFVP